MAASDLSLLFQLRADNAQAKAVMADTRQAVTQLRSQFGKELIGMQGIAKSAIADIGENVNAFVGQRIPLIGGAFLRVTTNLKGLNDELKKGGPQTRALAEQIDGIAKASGKSSAEVSRFLTTFVRLEGATARNNAAFKFFGGSVDLIGNKTAKFLPQLEEAGTSLAGVASEAEGAGGAVAGMAGPIGIAVIAVAALAIAAAAAAKEIFELTKNAAEFQGRMVDLAQQTGLEVETLSALEVVAKTTGGELGSITQAIVNFQRKLDDAQDPLSKTAEQFRKFHVATTDTETALRQTFAALAAMPPGFAQTNAAAEFFGARGGKQVLAILKETEGDLNKTITKLREMGILITGDTARVSDKFNDELELLNFQIRALGATAARDLIPAMIDVIRGMGDLVRAVRPVVALLSTLGGPVVRSVGRGLQDLSTLLRIVIGDYTALADAIKRAREEKEIKPLEVPDVAPVPLPGAPTPLQTTSEAVNTAEVVLADARRRAAQQNQALAALFQQGRINRDQEAKAAIESNRKVVEAEQQRIDALLAKKEQELRALEQAQRDRGEVVNRDTEAYRAVTAEIVKLQQERLDKENEFEVSSKAIRTKAAKENADARRNQIQNDNDLLASEFDQQIKIIESQIKRGEQAEEAGLAVIEQLERAKIDARIEALEEQKRVGYLTVQDQIDLDNRLKQLQQERDRLAGEQGQRRLDRLRATGQRAIAIETANIEALLQLEQIAGQRRIDALRAFADLRILTEEEAAKRILQIQLDLIDDEIEATRTKLKTADAIANKDERLKAQAALNNQIKTLTEERKSIEAQGFREIDEGRKRDLENERQYAEDLSQIRERINDIQRDTARDAIRLMELHFAKRKDIIRAQRDLELQEEEDRHKRAIDSINEQKREVDAEIKILETHIKALKIGTQEEIDEYDRLIKKLNDLKLKRLELERQQGAEVQFNKTRKRRVTDQANLEITNPDEALRDVFDDLGKSIVDLAGKFAELVGLGKEFSAISGQLAKQIGGTLAGAFDQVAHALGQTVANWVLLGETGPAVMRKILAQALASIAAEAAVNAIKELALGFATLFFNPAESAAHFTSAGLWAAIAGGSAIAGRAVAGDLFKQKTGGASERGAGSGAGKGSNPRDPIDLTRTQRNEQVIILRVESNDAHILKVLHDDVRNNGSTRGLIIDTVGA